MRRMRRKNRHWSNATAYMLPHNKLRYFARADKMWLLWAHRLSYFNKKATVGFSKPFSSNFIFFKSFNLKSSIKCTSSSPCTNRPLHCNLCKKLIILFIWVGGKFFFGRFHFFRGDGVVTEASKKLESVTFLKIRIFFD